MKIKATLSQWWAAALGPGDVPDLNDLNRAMQHLPAHQRIERAVQLLP